MTDITTLTKAGLHTNSLRATIPISIVKQFELKDGDKLIWDLIAVSDGEMGIKVMLRKIQK